MPTIQEKIMIKIPLRNMIEARDINVQDYIKSIDETKIISVEEIVKEQLKRNKKTTTLTQLQEQEKWTEPEGIKPDRAHTLEDIIQRVEANPEKPFSVSDVWTPTSNIFVIQKFNRPPDIQKAINLLNFRGCLNWSALDTPHFWLAKSNIFNGADAYMLFSAIGGHRTGMVIISIGYGSEMPCRITYIGDLDLKVVSEEASLIHHMDCNKRTNQTADDRIVSGVEAKDHSFVEVMECLIDCNLYVNEELMKTSETTGFRKCSSWQNFKSAIVENGYDNVKYAVNRLIEHTKDPEVILSQAAETIACFRNKFDKKIQNVSGDIDTLDVFLRKYFVINDQSDLKSNGKIVADTVELAHVFNKWAKKECSAKQAPIGNQTLIKAFGDKVDISAK